MQERTRPRQGAWLPHASVGRCRLALSDSLWSQILPPNRSSPQTQAEPTPYFPDQKTETQRMHLPPKPATIRTLGSPKCIALHRGPWEGNTWSADVIYLRRLPEKGCLWTKVHSLPSGTGGPATVSHAEKQVPSPSRESLLDSAIDGLSYVIISESLRFLE